MYVYMCVVNVLYAVDKGLRGRNVPQLVEIATYMAQDQLAS